MTVFKATGRQGNFRTGTGGGLQVSGHARGWRYFPGGNESKTDKEVLSKDMIESEVEVERRQCYGSY